MAWFTKAVLMLQQQGAITVAPVQFPHSSNCLMEAFHLFFTEISKIILINALNSILQASCCKA